jgi:DNA-binding response OmpR family regulator
MLGLDNEKSPMTDETRKRILIVDDDKAVSELLELALPEYELGVVGDAETALTVAPAFRPDLFIVELVLPGMRGTSLALLLRDNSDFALTPIFLLSGLISRSPGSSEPVRVNGLTAFAKPFELAVFRKHVELHLAGPESSRAAVEALAPGRIDGE